MQIFLGTDHGGFQYKEYIKSVLYEQDVDVIDCGAFELVEGDDYPAYAFDVAEKVAEAEKNNHRARGILLCRSGGGVVIAANKVTGVRAVQVQSHQEVVHARDNNNANIISIPGDWVESDIISDLVMTFLNTPFSNEERHVRRLSQILEYEQNN